MAISSMYPGTITVTVRVKLSESLRQTQKLHPYHIYHGINFTEYLWSPMEQWCQNNIVNGDWVWTVSSKFSFRNKSDAAWFVMVWM